MRKWSDSNTLFIMAPKGFARKSIEDNGIRAISPYHCDGLPFRPIREICFRLPFLPKKIWYNKKILENDYEYIIVIDVNITMHFLKWIMKKFPNAQLNFLYDNMVGKARNIVPNKIPNGYRIWTYDDYDAKKFGLRLFNNYYVNKKIQIPKGSQDIDVFFVGRDKGRGKKLLCLEKELKEMGLSTKFVITKDKKYSIRKSYHDKPISYDQVLSFDSHSRAILNITMDNQAGVTMRDIESVAIGTKLITTNKNIVNKDLYNPLNVFVLGQDNMSQLPSFLNEQGIDMWARIKENHTFNAMMDEITCSNSREMC